VEFPSVVNAVQCAQHIQAQFRAQNAAKETNEQIHVRIGIHSGDIVQRDGDVFGDGVNVASRLQALAEPDTICISQVVYQEVEKKLALGTVVSLGRPKLKNIAQRFSVYALLPEQPKGLRSYLQVQRLQRRRVGIAHLSWATLVVGLLIGGGIIALLSSSPIIRNPQSVIRNRESLPLPDKPSIVVLPFLNMSGDPEQEYFSDGLTEDLTSDLSQLSSLFVISRNSAFFYKGKIVKLPEVSRELGVRYVVEGSVRKAGDQVRVTAQLIDATQDHHLWSERYDRPMREIFALQDDITQQIITALRVAVQEAERERVKRTPTENLTAYDYVLHGWEYYHHITKDTNVQARQMFEKAAELDPHYAEAYAGMGWTYHMDWVWQWSQDPQTPARAFELAQKAVALDNSSPLVRQLLSQLYLLYKKQHAEALTEGERAIVLDPNNADGYARLALVLVSVDQPERAMVLLEKAMRLNPYYPPWYLLWLGAAYNAVGHYEEAIKTLREARVRDPKFLGPYLFLAVAYMRSGREEEARGEVAEILRLNPHFSVEGVKQRLSSQDQAKNERLIDELRRAGLK
ncbi:MAG: adenylate/guanylate cyclase domain-containing protein, partial [Deltaproteobacteria bacterium]|nr:adenylate/guanylate cyclase domain-containing protein [Deltaproteobacteria bacterium]